MSISVKFRAIQWFIILTKSIFLIKFKVQSLKPVWTRLAICLDSRQELLALTTTTMSLVVGVNKEFMKENSSAMAFKIQDLKE